MADLPFTNNVTRFLDARKISYRVLNYEYSEQIHSATQVAAALNLPPERVYKTLVLQPLASGKRPVAAVIPGPSILNLKRLARSLGEKKVRMAAHSAAEEWTGMHVGGISPVGLAQMQFMILIDERVCEHEEICISAGQRGTQIQIGVSDLVKVTRARLLSLT